MSNDEKLALVESMRRWAQEIQKAAYKIEQTVDLHQEPETLPGDALISAAGFSVRARKALYRAFGSNATLSKVAEFTAAKLLETRGCGLKTVQEIREKLARAGLKLRGE